MTAVIHDFAVCDGHVGEHLVVQHQSGQHGKGNVDLFLPAVDLDRLVLAVGVGIPDSNLAALARQLFGGDALAVQLICHTQSHGQLLVDVALIVDVLACGIPHLGVVAARRVALIALDVLDVVQPGLVAQRSLAQCVLHPVADDDLLHAPVGAGQHIDGFVLAVGQRRFLLGSGGLLRLPGKGRVLPRRADRIGGHARAAAYQQCRTQRHTHGLFQYISDTHITVPPLSPYPGFHFRYR